MGAAMPKGTRVRFIEGRVIAKPDLAGEWVLRRTAGSRDAVLFLHRDSDGANVATSRALVEVIATPGRKDPAKAELFRELYSASPTLRGDVDKLNEQLAEGTQIHEQIERDFDA